MAKGYNKAILIGHLGKDPEITTTQAGKQVCKFSLATSEKYKDSSGNMVDSTDWHNIVIWDRLGEVAAQYLKKGSKVLLEGRIKNRSYEKDGQTRYISEIVANNMVMLDGKEAGSNSGGYSQDFGNKPAQQSSAPIGSQFEEEEDLPF